MPSRPGISVTVAYQSLDVGCDGFYRPREPWITIDRDAAVNQQAAAFVHELAGALVRLEAATYCMHNWLPTWTDLRRAGQVY